MSAIAIVGIGCRFGGSPDLQGYWDLVRSGRNAFEPVPKDRFDADIYLDENRRAVDKSYAKIGAFIDDVRTFPGLHYGIPPRRIEVMDPQHRLALEMSVQAIEDSGRTPKDMPSRTGVFMGCLANEYRSMMSLRVMAQQTAMGAFGHVDDPQAILRSIERIVPSRPYSAPGALFNMMAAMVAQELDLKGPAYTVDAACASSLVAMVDAVYQLRNGTIDAAIAGGAYIQLTPEHWVAFCRVGAMSQKGVCRPFDSEADGFLQGDGGVALALKRVEDAERDGDRIYALIHGVATNNDGRADGPMAPDLNGQAEAIERAWDDAGIDRSLLGLAEAHGTGTDVGDVTEFKGLLKVFGGKAKHAALGSAKANVGHTNSAAGIAGIIRTVLAIHHATIPPLANFRLPKPDLHLDETPFYAPLKAEVWNTEDRYAGVSSFGFGGTNAHAVLGPAPKRSVAAPRAQHELVLMSAGTEAALRTLAARTADAIANDPQLTVAGVARAWSVRPAQQHRLAIVADSTADLAAKLRLAADGKPGSGVRAGLAPKQAPKIAYLYPGQGSQRVGMIAGTCDRFPTIAGALPAPIAALLWPAKDVDAETAKARLTDTANQQPVLHAVHYALTAVLDEVGVKPCVVTGHSLGEFTAAAVAGVLSAQDAATLVARRGRAMADLPGDHGAMAALMADEETVRGLLVDGAVIANRNHPRQRVVSGTTAAVAEVVRRAEAAKVKAIALDVSHAFHSPVLAGLDPEAILAGLALHEPKVPVASGIQDHVYIDAAEAGAVFRRHATSPVDFEGALRQCSEAGATVFLQIGAGGPLAAFARGALPKGTLTLTLAGQEDNDAGVGVLDTLGALFVAGVAVNVRPITATADVASVPAIVLPREEYWGVKDEPQLLPKLPGVASVPQGEQKRAAPKGAVQAAPTAEDAASGDDVLDRVLAVISKVSAYPRNALRPEMALQDDLGFDSLMVGDLATSLADAFPGLGGIPQELLINRPKVGDIIAYARGGSQNAQATIDDDAPLGAYAVTHVRAPLPKLPTRAIKKGVKTLVVGEGPLAQAIARAFGDAGAEARIVSVSDAGKADPVDALVWAVDAGVPALIAALAAQDKQDAQPDVLLALPVNAEASAEPLAAVARAMAREWPESVCKAVRVVNRLKAEDVGKALVAEWTSVDRTVDVWLSPDARQIPGLTASTPSSLWKPGAGEVVAITGGTRGIGAKLGLRLVETGCKVVLVGRGAPDADGAAAVAKGAVVLSADVTDPTSLAMLAAHAPTALVHAAGVLADGPVGSVDAAKGLFAWSVKVDGFRNTIAACGPSLKVALAVGSWAARFGSRHQTWYAAANAACASVEAAGVRVVVAEFGPWSSSAMAKTIPAPVQQAMRAEGVDFVGDKAGLDAIVADLGGPSGVVVHGRDLPPVLRNVVVEETISLETHPFLADHAIEGTPILPLASATDLLARAACVDAPFEVSDLRLFQGILVKEPIRIRAIVRNDRAELRQGEKSALAYRARIRPLTAPAAPSPTRPEGGSPPTLLLKEFYAGITFHGPMLQGITSIDRVGDGFVRGKVHVGKPSTWSSRDGRAAFAVDPLAFDSAMQLSGYVAWTRFQRAGTPVGFAKYVQYRAPKGDVLDVVVTFDPNTAADGDRFTGTIEFSDAHGVVAVATDVSAELRAKGGEEALVIKREWVDIATWAGVKDIEGRKQAAQMIGIQNPYFKCFDDTAKDVIHMDGRELVHFSGYNYIGLSGDTRVIEAAHQAMIRLGTSVSASRVASGQRPFHIELEQMLAKCQGVEDALLFTAGHATNVTVVGHMMGANDLVLHDELIHDSILQGIKLSGAARRGFKHDDPSDLERQLKAVRKNFEKVLIVVEGVYSMDGDLCDLPSYIALKKKYGCLLMVDEAHSFGVIGATGCGAREHWGIDGNDVDVWMGTLSKSLSSCGGWVAGRHKLIEWLRYTAPGFIYSAGLTPQNGYAALMSLKLMLQEPERVAKLQSNARFFQKALVDGGVDTGPARGGSGVVPAVTGNSMHALLLSQRLLEQGVNVQPIVYPAVADDAARLRFFLSSLHSEAQLAHVAKLVSTTLAGIRKDFPVPGK